MVPHNLFGIMNSLLLWWRVSRQWQEEWQSKSKVSAMFAEELGEMVRHVWVQSERKLERMEYGLIYVFTLFSISLSLHSYADPFQLPRPWSRRPCISDRSVTNWPTGSCTLPNYTAAATEIPLMPKRSSIIMPPLPRNRPFWEWNLLLLPRTF